MDHASIETFRQRLIELRDRVTSQVNMVEDAIPQDAADPTDISSVHTHPADEDSEGVEDNVLVAQSQVGIVQQIDEALERIRRGTFGTCTACSREISRERLEAIPYTPYCIDDARRNDSGAASQPLPLRPGPF